jgi:hypothetical protein
MNIEDIKNIEFIYSGLTNQQIQDIVLTVAQANNYQFTITQPALDASGNTIVDISGNTVYEEIENPVDIITYTQDIIDKQLQAYVINCKKKIAERELQNTMSEFRTTIINIKSNTD